MNIIIWGAGDGGLRLKTMLLDNVNIKAFIDINPDKTGTTLENIPIIAPTQIQEYDYDFIVIGNMHSQAIMPTLLNEYKIAREKIVDYYHLSMFNDRVGTLRAIADEIDYKKLSGSVAELGVAQGEFAKYINVSFKDKKFYLFDTFEGFDKRDVDVESCQNFSDSTQGEFKDTSVELVLSKMKHKDNITVKKGYFPESAEGIDETFCFVSIDTDLYKPIYDGLNFFYPKLVKGGYILIHDYNSTRFFGAKTAVRQFADENNVNIIPMMDLCGSAIIVKQ